MCVYLAKKREDEVRMCVCRDDYDYDYDDNNDMNGWMEEAILYKYINKNIKLIYKYVLNYALTLSVSLREMRVCVCGVWKEKKRHIEKDDDEERENN